jgi:hypothetical protein
VPPNFGPGFSRSATPSSWEESRGAHQSRLNSTVGDALQADRFLPGDHGADGLLLKFELLFLARLRKRLRAQQASHVVGAETGAS